MSNVLKSGYGGRLREERVRLGLNQQGFAERAGIKRATQYLYEKEEGAPNYRFLMAIAELGVDMHYIFFGEHYDPSEVRFNINTLMDIFDVVDEICRDDSGKLLPRKSRSDFFKMLCVAYSGRKDEQVDIGVVKALFNG